MKKIISFVLLLLALFCVTIPGYALTDGAYCVDVTMTGGSGKASVVSPAAMDIKNGEAFAELIWSSANYDYMLVDGSRFDNLAEEGMNSRFYVPITCWDAPMEVVADTTAMGKPIEIHYQLTFYADSVADRSELPQDAAIRVLYMAAAIIVVGGILNYWIKKKTGR